jgi:hypothetical protein
MELYRVPLKKLKILYYLFSEENDQQYDYRDKGKVVPVLIKHYAMKAYGGVDV